MITMDSMIQIEKNLKFYLILDNIYIYIYIYIYLYFINKMHVLFQNTEF